MKQDKMKKLKLNILLLLAIASIQSIVMAQQSKTSLKLIVRPLPDSILLRWAPANFEGWDAGNKYGYKIIRFTLMRNGEMVSQPAPEQLTPEPIKPWPLQQWDKIIDKDNYAAIAAQAIYGETFELTATRKTSVFDVVNKVKEQDSRFSFALFAADQSPLAAKASGVWFTDRKVVKGEKYLYRVILASPAGIVTSDTAFAYTGVDEYLPLPKPLELKAEFGDKGVIIHWDRKILNYVFNSYSLERSEDGKNFTQLNKEPIVYAKSEEFQDADELLFIDSLAVNGKPYYYRVIGHTAFGEKSPPSVIVSGKGTDEIKVVPEISKGSEMNGQILLKWTYPEQEITRIAGFKIARSSSFKSRYDTISRLIAPGVREFTDKKPLPANYYKVLVIGKDGTFKGSVPSMVQLVDSIPPAPPTGLKAVADTSGKLILTWKANTEEDMYGYRIYRANASNEEYSQITVSPIQDTIFIDHINLKTLTRKIYYQLMAIDKRQNHSGFSQPLEVERPDVVPPAPPALKGIKSTTKGVTLEWIKSTSDDVVKHLILRKEKGKSDYQVIKEIPVNDTLKVYTDSSALVNTVYHYQVIAQDKSGLKSVPSAEMAGQKMASDSPDGLGEISYKADRKNFKIILKWNNPSEKVSRYIIYRKAGENGTLTVYANIPGDKPEFVDSRIKADTTFTYMVQAMLSNENRMMSKQVKVGF
jgi:fibronectin type 3 domain-containing protein